MQSVVLNNGVFQAEIVPEVGGNIIALRHLPSGTKLLREPPDLATLARFPAQYGLPVLFPPNRVEDGSFLFQNRRCQLPVNELSTHNHLHGLVLDKPWQLVSRTRETAELVFGFPRTAPEYEVFPFAFTLRRTLTLTGTGLAEHMSVLSESEWDMPLGLGFHSTFPAAPARVRVSADEEQFEIGERFLPTGRMTGWTEFCPREWFDPCKLNAGFHCRSKPLPLEDGTLLHGAEICYPEGLLRYLTDEKFGFWYGWNKRGKGDFISLEPVSWMANALNRKAPPEETGMRVLASHETAQFRNELRFEPDTKNTCGNWGAASPGRRIS